MDDDATALVYEHKGQIAELENRIDKISERLDDHISTCSTRFFILIAAVAGATAILGILIHAQVH